MRTAQPPQNAFPPGNTYRVTIEHFHDGVLQSLHVNHGFQEFSDPDNRDVDGEHVAAVSDALADALVGLCASRCLALGQVLISVAGVVYENCLTTHTPADELMETVGRVWHSLADPDPTRMRLVIEADHCMERSPEFIEEMGSIRDELAGNTLVTFVKDIDDVMRVAAPTRAVPPPAPAPPL